LNPKRLSRFDGLLDLRKVASLLNGTGVSGGRNSRAVMAANRYPGFPIRLHTPIDAAITRQAVPI
jgi:hypothetical protein